MNAKYVNFFQQLSTVVGSLDPVEVKLTIGDSINNNRTLTINQVARFLTGSRNRRFKLLGNSLLAVKGILNEDLINSRNNNRTDALDINEFLNFYGETVINGGYLVNTIGRTVNISA